MLLAVLLLAAAHVDAQVPPQNAGPDPVKNMCMRWWSQSIVKNDVLYIDSGVEKFNVSGDVFLGINNHILSIPLKESWDWKVPAGQPRGLNITVTRKNVTNPDTGTPVPNQIRGHLFHGPSNTSQIYTFGGTTYMFNQSFEGYRRPDSSTYPLWTYDPSADKPWDQHDLNQKWQPNHGAATEDTARGVGFYLGGQIDLGTSTKTMGQLFDNNQTLYMPLGGMLVIDLADSTSTNISTSSMKRSEPRVGGTMEYVDAVGGGGILVALGGQIQPGKEFGKISNRTQGELIDFKTVDVFDLKSYYDNPSSNGTWYQQTTTGEIPPPRIDFCTVYISAPDNSSHHIYLYGGVDPINNKFYDDVVVLTIPSFKWKNIWPVGESPRLGHNCHRVGKRQMVTVGGNVTNLRCDWEKKGVAFLDLTTVEWGSVFKGETDDFKVPKNVFGDTNGTADGKATISEPAGGWTEEGLGKIFRTSRYPLPSSWGINGETPETKDDQQKKKTNVGAIIGGVVGGIVALALLAGGLFLWHRRRLRSRAPTELHGDDIARPASNYSEKSKHELQGVNENEPAELPGPDAVELNAPRQAVEADHSAAIHAAELPGTNIVAGGVHGVPIVRTPGDDLPESPEYTPGLKRLSGVNTSRRRRSSEVGRDVQQPAEETTMKEEAPKDYFDKEKQEKELQHIEAISSPDRPLEQQAGAETSDKPVAGKE